MTNPQVKFEQHQAMLCRSLAKLAKLLNEDTSRYDNAARYHEDCALYAMPVLGRA